MTGKERCEFLRNIRKNIAEMNNLDYTPSVCTHDGWCPGYCPVCDREAADLMRQLERKEAAGCQIHIDVESIKALDNMAKERSEDYDDDDDIGTRTMGIMAAPPEDIDMLKGDVAAPGFDDEDDGDSEIMPTQVNNIVQHSERIYMGETSSPYSVDPKDVISESKNALDDSSDNNICMKDAIDVCQGCLRFDSIKKKDGKPLRCAALSEHFFERALVRGICHIKKTSEEETDPNKYKKSPVQGCYGA